MKRLGIFYGSSTCYTEMVAERIAQMIGGIDVDLIDIASLPLSRATDYDCLLFGIPTWDYGELQEDWDTRWDELDALDLSGRTAAVFGLGDQVGYPQWFQDAMGYLYHKLAAQGADMVGNWPDRGYRYEASQALTDGGDFVGLALDEENQADQTGERLHEWLAQLAPLMEFQLRQP